jgi:hypothetical protein
MAQCSACNQPREGAITSVTISSKCDGMLGCSTYNVCDSCLPAFIADAGASPYPECLTLTIVPPTRTRAEKRARAKALKAQAITQGGAR